MLRDYTKYNIHRFQAVTLPRTGEMMFLSFPTAAIIREGGNALVVDYGGKLLEGPVNADDTVTPNLDEFVSHEPADGDFQPGELMKWVHLQAAKMFADEEGGLYSQLELFKRQDEWNLTDEDVNRAFKASPGKQFHVGQGHSTINVLCIS